MCCLPVQVLLADTTGEMFKFINSSDIVIMGKSLAGHDEGHNLIEPALLDKPVVTGAVLRNFRFILDVLKQAEAVVNNAKAYQNAKIPSAQAEADKLIQNAEYLKQKRINEAKEKVAMFVALYDEFARNPEITRSRMYYEAISKILPGVKVYINTGTGNAVEMLLPLESLMGGK